MSKYKLRADGEWFHIKREGHLIACCDCGLVHMFKARVRAHRVEISAKRMPRHTGGKRSRIAAGIKGPENCSDEHDSKAKV